MKYILAIFLVCFTFCFVPAQKFEEWQKINNGFGKCVEVGESGDSATWYEDDFRVEKLLRRREVIYAYITYGDGTSHSGQKPPQYDSRDCPGGLFKYDTITYNWIRVANPVPVNNDKYEIITDHNEIFAFGNGIVYQFDFEYDGDGWKKLSKDTIRWDSVWNTNCNECAAFNCSSAINISDQIGGIKALSNKIYTVFLADTSQECYDNKLGVFNITDSTWSITDFGPLPHHERNKQVKADSLKFVFLQGASHSGNAEMDADIYLKYDNFLKCNREPGFIWYYNPQYGVDSNWVNISSGINYKKSMVLNCHTEDCRECQKRRIYDIKPGFNQKDLWVSTPKGIWKRVSGIWEQKSSNASEEPMRIFPNSVKNRVYGIGPRHIGRFDKVGLNYLGDGSFYDCAFNNFSHFENITP